MDQMQHAQYMLTLWLMLRTVRVAGDVIDIEHVSDAIETECVAHLGDSGTLALFEPRRPLVQQPAREPDC